MTSFNVQCNPSKRYMEELRKTKKRLLTILELLAKISCQLLDLNPIAVCTEPVVTFDSLVITMKLLADCILYAKLVRPFQWPCGLRRGFASPRMLELLVESCRRLGCVFCKCFVLSGAGLCDGPIPCPEESYRVWCVVECGQVQQ